MIAIHRIGLVASGLLVVFLASCSSSGPRTTEIVNSPNATVVERDISESYAVIGVDRDVARLATQALLVKPNFFSDTGSGGVVIGTGDALQITIVSTNNSGFVDFTTSSLSPISSSTLPPQTVSEVGTVNVPPIGRINAQNQTIPAFENLLQQKLADVLVDPSVIVQMVDRRSARATLIGSVGKTGSVPLNEVDTRLIDVIAAAGGPQGRPEDLQLSLSRRGQTQTIPLDALFETPRYNIHARSGDVISIDTPNRKLTVLGATGTNTTLQFDEPEVSLTDALGRIGGIQGRRANRRGVFVYREVPREVVASFGADVSGLAATTVPTIFRFDFSEPTILFIAQDFAVADGDVLYIADNINEEIASVFAALNPFVPAPVQIVSSAIEN